MTWGPPLCPLRRARLAHLPQARACLDLAFKKGRRMLFHGLTLRATNLTITAVLNPYCAAVFKQLRKMLKAQGSKQYIVDCLPRRSEFVACCPTASRRSVVLYNGGSP